MDEVVKGTHPLAPEQQTDKAAPAWHHKLLRFIPPVVVQDPNGLDARKRRVAILFLDVAGFTHLSEALAAQGPEGAEQLEILITAISMPPWM